MKTKISHEMPSGGAIRVARAALVAGVCTLFSGLALAAAPLLHTTKSVDVDASASKVWGIVKDFSGINNWHPAVAKDEIVEGTDNTAGAVRHLTLKDGGTIQEKLLAYNAAGRSMKYEILESVLPVSHYSSTISVKSTGKGKSTITWSGHYKRKNTGDNPGDKENDQAASDTIAAVYQGGLDNVKKLAEGH
ncbi:MAG TPA: SRPBCC family protein [Steroidobacteraceae bacterium]|jgi:mxaD protein|nr:SRPBCC family protein [Steroidobacteraceae bacterium]